MTFWFCPCLVWTWVGRFTLSPSSLAKPDVIWCCAWMSNVLVFCCLAIRVYSVFFFCHLSYPSHWIPVALPFQLIIGFESGIVVLWDLKSKKAEYRYTYDEVHKSHPHFLLSSNSIHLRFWSTAYFQFLLMEKLKIQSHTHDLSNTVVWMCVWVCS